MTKTSRVWQKVIFGMAFVVMLQGTVMAQMNGHNLKGDYGLQSGSQPAPGWYGSLLYLNYDFDTVRNRHGDALQSMGGDITVQAISPILVGVTEKKLWGANYAFLIAPSWINNSLDSPLLERDLKTDTDFGDLYVQPLHLGWHKDHVDYVAGLGLFIPTGRYDDGADDNVGLGMWSFEIFGGTTYFFDTAKTWHASVLGSYETHTDKEHSDVKVGDILTLEGGVGKSFMEGAINVGVSYFTQWKITDDDFGKELLKPDVGKHEIYGVGPELSVPIFVTEKSIGLLDFRYYWDFGSESTTEGETFLLTFTWATL
jgi:hypothetical protein